MTAESDQSSNVVPFAGFRPSGCKQCPRCNYSLTGLPAQHTCPECGFTYDEHTMVWKRIRPRIRIPLQLSLEAVPAMLIFGILIWQSPKLFGVNRWLLIMTLAGVASGLYRLLRGPTALCLTPSGVEIYPRGVWWPNRISWPDVGVTHCMGDRYFVTRMTRSQNINISAFFDRPNEHRDFEIALEECRQRYQ